MFAATMDSALNFAHPDVCIVPTAGGPVPMALPNQASWATAVFCVPAVLIAGRPTVVISSQIPMSSGDEAGTGGGVVSGMNKGPITPKEASAKVFASNQPIVMHTAATAHNGVNANAPVGQHTTPGQTTVVLGL